MAVAIGLLRRFIGPAPRTGYWGAKHAQNPPDGMPALFFLHRNMAMLRCRILAAESLPTAVVAEGRRH
jgi:hypothetical protein